MSRHERTRMGQSLIIMWFDAATTRWVAARGCCVYSDPGSAAGKIQFNLCRTPILARSCSKYDSIHIEFKIHFRLYKSPPGVYQRFRNMPTSKWVGETDKMYFLEMFNMPPMQWHWHEVREDKGTLITFFKLDIIVCQQTKYKSEITANTWNMRVQSPSKVPREHMFF